MAAVALNFVPPDVPDLTELLIYESDAQNGTYALIDTIPDVGTYPDYVTRYTTTNAVSANGWFKILWRDSKGAETPLSVAIQGGTSTTVGEIIDRVLNRSPSADEQTVQQVAEAAVEMYFHTDPYTVAWSDLSYREREGLTILTLAFSQQMSTSSATGGKTKWVAGLVSLETDAGGATANDELFKLAYQFLGISRSKIAQMAEIVIAGGSASVEKDQSRLLLSEFV